MENILKEFQQLPTTCVSDALRRLSNMDTSIKPLEEHYTVCGPARTVKAMANDNLF